MTTTTRRGPLDECPACRFGECENCHDNGCPCKHLDPSEPSRRWVA